MITIIRNADRSIKTFADGAKGGDLLAAGETVELIPASFAEYASRLMLSCGGRSGENIRVAQNSGDVTVEVSCPGELSVVLDINGIHETLPLINGKAALILGTEVAGSFTIQPADKVNYCAAGQAVLRIEVI